MPAVESPLAASRAHRDDAMAPGVFPEEETKLNLRAKAFEESGGAA